MTRRATLAGISAGLLLLGCTVGAPTESEPEPRSAPVSGSSADATTTAEAIGLLRAGTAFVDQTSFRSDVDIASQITTLSHSDNVHKRSIGTISTPGGGIEIRMIDDEVYMRIGLPMRGVGDGWMVLDPARVPSDFALSFAPGRNDFGGSGRLIDAIVTARANGPQITGTIDATRVRAGNGISFQPPPGGALPDGARSHAFRATLDTEGRLVSFLMPEASGLPNASLRYSDFGTTVTVARPSGAVPAPDALYPQLGLGGGR
ncbi:hypothetical protein NIE79_004355 [Micromonospora sp. NIE79]|uniref:LppX_LprAFG lipoprotein n=1 Tax=Micromonospora trifolii TaxID=2911208 RepID=A0ABS9N7A1_9ACTN|nr:hypothetical protein [Micromonospora trifolii]MCG5445832.1 hypothetical protein [Micromonospora trifolii]